MKKILKVLTEPKKSLREKSIEVLVNNINSPEIQELIKKMTPTMQELDGVGLAAPQVGENIRLIIIQTEEGPLALVNPEITKKSWAKEWGEEGCLSVPKTFGLVQRHKKINCIFYDQKGKKRKIQVSGLMARVIQHEVDHLDGVLFIDKAKKIKKID